jgi:thiamine kinase-like enzyme
MAKPMGSKATIRLLELKRGIISKGRANKYLSNTRTLEKIAGNPIDAILPDLEKTHRLAEKIDASEYTPATRSDLRLLLKMLWKVANGHDLEDRPKEIRWL